MNKKADVEISKLIVLLLAVMALLSVGIWFYTTWSNSTNQLKDIGDSIKPDSNLFNLNEKSLTLKEKERCAKFTNPNDCTGIIDQKSGCFWGKNDVGVGCYSCINNRQYFGDEYGNCRGYNKIFLSKVNILIDDNGLRYGFELNSNNYEKDDEKTCNINPCNFNKNCYFTYNQEFKNKNDVNMGAIFCS